jgi:hypothetical protein
MNGSGKRRRVFSGDKKPWLVKGSKEAKERMAKLRNMRGKKM